MKKKTKNQQTKTNTPH